MLVGLWLVAISSWRLRNWRAVAVGIAGTIAIVAAGSLPWPLSPGLQAAAWGAVLFTFLLRTELVSVMSPDEARFVEEYIQNLEIIGRLKGARNVDPTGYVARFEAAVHSIEGLEAPAEWSDLQVDTAAELRRRLTMMKVLVMPSLDAREAADIRWLALEERFRRLYKERAAFWRGFPALTLNGRH
jgi:hypothetical protein